MKSSKKTNASSEQVKTLVLERSTVKVMKTKTGVQTGSSGTGSSGNWSISGSCAGSDIWKHY